MKRLILILALAVTNQLYAGAPIELLHCNYGVCTIEEIGSMSNNQYLRLAKKQSSNGSVAIGVNLSDPNPNVRILWVLAAQGEIVTTTLVE